MGRFDRNASHVQRIGSNQYPIGDSRLADLPLGRSFCRAFAPRCRVADRLGSSIRIAFEAKIEWFSCEGITLIRLKRKWGKSVRDSYAKAKSAFDGNSFVFKCNARLTKYSSIAAQTAAGTSSVRYYRAVLVASPPPMRAHFRFHFF